MDTGSIALLLFAFLVAASVWWLLKSRRRDAGEHIRHGDTALRQGRTAEASRDFGQAARMKPNSAEAHMGLGRALSVSSRDAAKAIASKPDARTYILLGNSLREKGETESAILEYRRAIALESNNVMAHFFLGEALQMNEDVDGAIEEFREATRLSPNDADSHWKFGEVLEEKANLEDDEGDPKATEDNLEAAAGEYARARELAPTDGFVSEMYSALDPEMKRRVRRQIRKRRAGHGNGSKR